jgi:hypothetical protein
MHQGILDSQHKLFRLAEMIDWEAAHHALQPFYSRLGRRALPIRLMVGLHLLKHLECLSDEQCADRVRGDLYWMHFCGVSAESLQGKYAHLNSSSMTKFRNRIGPRGFQAIEELIRRYLIDSRRIDPRVMTVDSTCMEKNVEYPTDSGLLDKGRRNLLNGMKKLQALGVRPIHGSLARIGPRGFKPERWSWRGKLFTSGASAGPWFVARAEAPRRRRHLRSTTSERSQAADGARASSDSSSTQRIARKIPRLCIPRQGKTKHPEHEKRWFRRGQARRSAIEAVIGQLKQHHGLGRCRYAGFAGDKINLSLGSTAWNLSKLVR